MPNKNKGLISIIVPVYNTPIWMLDECFESIRKQTYKNFDIILIDDGSDKECASYLDGITMDNGVKNNVHLYHRKNHGVSAARNFGLEKADGEYICFVDADDCLHESYLEFLIRCAVETKCAVIRCRNTHDKDALNDKVLYSSVKIEINVHGYVHSGMYSKSVIGEHRFDERFFYYEDTLFDSSVVGSERFCGIVDSKLYFYRKSPNSLTSSIDSLRYFSGLSALDVALNDANRGGVFRKNNLFTDNSPRTM